GTSLARILLVCKVPVDHVAEGLDIIGAWILILQVVGMLPDIDTDDRRQPLRETAILIVQPDNGELAVAVFHQPGPAASKHLQRRRAKLLGKFIVGAKLLVDRLGKLPGRLAAFILLQQLPEKG